MEIDNIPYEPCIVCGLEIEAHYEQCYDGKDCGCYGARYNTNVFCSDHCEKEFEENDKI